MHRFLRRDLESSSSATGNLHLTIEVSRANTFAALLSFLGNPSTKHGCRAQEQIALSQRFKRLAVFLVDPRQLVETHGGIKICNSRHSAQNRREKTVGSK